MQFKLYFYMSATDINATIYILIYVDANQFTWSPMFANISIPFILMCNERFLFVYINRIMNWSSKGIYRFAFTSILRRA
jgi:hypothetical protein